MLNPENTLHVKVFYSLLFSSLFLWWSGLLGADLYKAPSLLLIIFLFYLVQKKYISPDNYSCNSKMVSVVNLI